MERFIFIEFNYYIYLQKLIPLTKDTIMQNGPNTPVKRTGTGEDKTWDNGSGKVIPKDQQPAQKTYHKNPDTGKMEEYTGKTYQDATPLWKKADAMHNNTHDVDKSQDPKMPAGKSTPRFYSRPSFD